MNYELPDVQAGFRKGRGTRDQIANIPLIIEKAKRVPEKHLLLFIDYAKVFDCMDHNKLWKILKEMPALQKQKRKKNKIQKQHLYKLCLNSNYIFNSNPLGVDVCNMM